MDLVTQGALERQQQRLENHYALQKQARDAQAAQIQTSLNNPDLNTADRQALIQQMMGLYQPHEAPNLIQRLSGLIKGKQQPAAATPPVSSAAPALPTSDYSTPSGGNELGTPLSAAQPPITVHDAVPPPDHPFTPHPVLGKMQEGLQMLGNHLAGFAHPQSAPPAGTEPLPSLLARTTITPTEEMAKKYELIQDNATKLQQQKNAGMIEAARLRAGGIRGLAGHPLSLESAINLDNAGQPITDLDGKPIDLEMIQKTVPNAKLTPYYHGTTFMGYEVADQLGHTITANNQVTPVGQFGTRLEGVPSLGAKTVPVTTSRSSTDPIGLTTTSTSTRTPLTPAGGVSAAPAPVAGPAAPISSAAPTSPLASVNSQIAAGNAGSKKLNKGKPLAAPVSSAAPQVPATPSIQLDSNFQLPPDSDPNPNIREAAQQLLDGQDQSKINPKVKMQAETLARKAGWSQGTFTPKEKVQLNEASNFLNNLYTSPSLAVLDSTISKAKIATVLNQAKAQGLAGNLLSAFLASNLTPQEADFIKNFNAAVATVSGLSMLTRGGGRQSDASINRVVKELPNVLQSKDEEDGKGRIENLLKELDIAANTKGTTPMAGSKGPVSKAAPKLSTWKVPADAPPAPQADNKVLKDGSGQVIAKSLGGKWVQP